MEWIKEDDTSWNNCKRMMFESSDVKGAFSLPEKESDNIEENGYWWILTDGKEIVGYGWITVGKDDHEISLVIKEGKRRSGLGEIILDNLVKEAENLGAQRIVALVKWCNLNPLPAIKLLYKKEFKMIYHGAEKGLEYVVNNLSKFQRAEVDMFFVRSSQK